MECKNLKLSFAKIYIDFYFEILFIQNVNLTINTKNLFAIYYRIMYIISFRFSLFHLFVGSKKHNL